MRLYGDYLLCLAQSGPNRRRVQEHVVEESRDISDRLRRRGAVGYVVLHLNVFERQAGRSSVRYLICRNHERSYVATEEEPMVGLVPSYHERRACPRGDRTEVCAAEYSEALARFNAALSDQSPNAQSPGGVGRRRVPRDRDHADHIAGLIAVHRRA